MTTIDHIFRNSHLLHRLRLLEIPWGVLSDRGQRQGKGTFHEFWDLQWRPELILGVVEAGRWGTTIVEAATRRAVAKAGEIEMLGGLADLVHDVLLADLTAAAAPVVQLLEERSSLANDAGQLLDALPALSRIVRYGNVRQSDAGAVQAVFEGLVLRAAIGLPGACASLDDEAAENYRQRILSGHGAIGLAAADAGKKAWLAALGRLAVPGTTHGLLAGLAARLRFDESVADAEDTAEAMSLALSVANDSAAAAAWLEGFLNRSGMVLLHDAELWRLVDTWVAGLNEEHFVQILPLVRRAFASLNAHERRQIGEKALGARGSRIPSRRSTPGVSLDWNRASMPIPLVRVLLGLPAEPVI